MNEGKSPSNLMESEMKDVKKAKKKNGRKRECLFIQRDIAEGRPFNNSFTGPYPEDNDHLHKDTGPNPQF